MDRSSVREWIGQPYTGQHGCLAFVRDVYSSEFGRDFDSPESFYQFLLDYGVQVSEPRSGDFVLFQSDVLHIGYMVSQTQFLHCYENGASIVSDIDRPDYQSTLIGFYRVYT